MKKEAKKLAETQDGTENFESVTGYSSYIECKLFQGHRSTIGIGKGAGLHELANSYGN